MLDKVIDIYLTPRFWKGELVYDGRRPILVYQKPQQRFRINEQKPYPPQYTRKLLPQDGIIYELSQLKNVKNSQKSIGIKMLICVTMQDNIAIQFLQRTLTGIYKNFVKLVNNRGMSPKDIAVVIIQDGILKLVNDNLHRKMSSSVRFFQKIDYNSGKCQCKLISRINQILGQIQQFQKNDLKSFTQKNGGLPPTVPKNTSLLYQFQWKPSKQLEGRYKLGTISPDDPDLRVMACFKHLNAKKLSSHLWFFQGFCRLLSPEYCTLMDVGTQPYETGLIKFIEALESDDKLGGVSGFMTLDIHVKSSQSQLKTTSYQSHKVQSKKYPLQQICAPLPVISALLFIITFIISKLLSCLKFLAVKFLVGFHQLFSAQRAQLFQYNFSHMFDKNFQSFFSYLNVLPGAWSAYRYEAISRGNRYQQNLLQKNYLKMVLDPQYTQKDYKQANVYLAEDRVLCLGIYCQKDERFNLQYIPQALAKTDPMENLVDLMIQRRRWINSSYFAFDFIFKSYNFDVRESSHGFTARNLLLPFVMLISKLSIINTYFGISIFFFSLYTATFETYNKFKPPQEFIRGSPWVLIPATICLGYLAAVIGLIVISLHKKANQNQIAYKILSSLLGLYNIFLIAIVVIYILFNYALRSDLEDKDRIIWEIIKYLTIINFGCLVIPIFMHLFTHPMRVIEMLDPRTFLSYLYYQAAYTHTFVIYAFSNVDDVTWGTKGVQQDKSAALKTSQKQQAYYRCKLQFFGIWIAGNACLCFILIIINEVFVQQQNKAIALTAIGVYSTSIVVVKCIFGMLHHFRFIFLQLFCLRKVKYDKVQKQNMEKRLKKRTVLVSKNILSCRELQRPSNAILPPDLLNDIYEEGKINGGSGRNLFKEPYSPMSD